ncbi:MAG: hypothetical protein OXG95_06395 [Chloroflexi bacterium]|nr:hypothetical protein [Chloroflexota bacterium]
MTWLRWVLVAFVLITALASCDASSDRVYDNTTLRLTAYLSDREGEVLLDWTGGPSGYRRWEYSIWGWPEAYPEPEWHDVPAGPASRQLRLRLDGKGYEFKIRERGDPRDPSETNPGAVSRIAIRDANHEPVGPFHQPLEPGGRFWITSHGLSVMVPSEGRFQLVSECGGYLIRLYLELPKGDLELSAYVLAVPSWRIEDMRASESATDKELLGAPGLEARQEGQIVRELAESDENPDRRRGYGLLVGVLESMFGRYPPTASDGLAEAVCH